MEKSFFGNFMTYLKYQRQCRERLSVFRISYETLEVVLARVDAHGKGYLGVEDLYELLKGKVTEN